MSPEMFRKLASLGLSHDQMAGVLEIFEEDAGERRAKVKARVDKWRSKNKPETLRNVTERSETSPNVSERLVRVEGSSLKEEISKEDRKKESAAKPRGDLDAFKSELSSILDPARVEAIVAVRRKKGATMTAHAGSLLVAALKACPDPSAAADEMVLRNWTGIKPEWLESRSTPLQRSAAAPAGQNFNDILDNLQGKNRNDAFSGSTVDASVNGTDRGGPTNLVQLHAISARS